MRMHIYPSLTKKYFGKILENIHCTKQNIFLRNNIFKYFERILNITMITSLNTYRKKIWLYDFLYIINIFNRNAKKN
jgi:hypothetical protein